MRQPFDPLVEMGRDKDDPVYATAPGENQGRFMIYCTKTRRMLVVIASGGADWLKSGLTPPVWEHVSVSTKDRCPNWDEMCFVKDLFFLPEECVIQFHPPKSNYVNCHPFVLHLWRPIGIALPMPPTACV